MNRFVVLLLLLPMSVAIAQTKPTQPTPPAIVSAVAGITGKQFEPDTAYAALTDEDRVILAREPIANWGLPQTGSPAMQYYNLIVGTRSYQLVVVKSPKTEFPTATLLRFLTPKSKPEPIARGTLKPKTEPRAN